MIEATLFGIAVLLVLTPAAMISFFAMIWLPLRIMGIRLRDALREITYAEAVFYGLYSVACAFVVSAVFSRFI